MCFFPDLDAAARFAAESSRTRHGAEECIDACRLLARITCRALRGEPKEQVRFADAEGFAGGERVAAIARGSSRDKEAPAIRGSGSVVESLEAALWACSRTERFAEAVLAAANPGDDADTTALVCGHVAGASCGEKGIPVRWVDQLARRDEIAALADALRATGSRRA